MNISFSEGGELVNLFPETDMQGPSPSKDSLTGAAVHETFQTISTSIILFPLRGSLANT